MVANITFEKVKNLLKQELALVNAKLEELFNQLNEINSTVKFWKTLNFDGLLNEIKNTNENVTRLASDMANGKVNIKRVEKLAIDEWMNEWMKLYFISSLMRLIRPLSKIC